MSFSSYDKAVKCIELLKTIDCKVELQQWSPNPYSFVNNNSPPYLWGVVYIFNGSPKL